MDLVAIAVVSKGITENMSYPFVSNVPLDFNLNRNVQNRGEGLSSRGKGWNGTEPNSLYKNLHCICHLSALGMLKGAATGKLHLTNVCKRMAAGRV